MVGSGLCIGARRKFILHSIVWQTAMRNSSCREGNIHDIEPIPRPKERGVRIKIVGWSLAVTGTILWLYGYLSIGHQALFDWHASAPWWIADFLPNLEAEIGTALMLVSLLAIYWPAPVTPRRP